MIYKVALFKHMQYVNSLSLSTRTGKNIDIYTEAK